jgi:hypothetical protein
MERCELYSLFLINSSLKTWQIRYCENEFTKCERYALVCGHKNVPPNLLPNGKLLPMPKKKDP